MGKVKWTENLNRKGCFAFLVFLAAFWGDTSFAVERLKASGDVKIGAQAPGLSGWGLNNKVLDLKKFLPETGAKYVLVTFFATWCMPCREGLKALNEAKGALKERGVGVLAVDVGEGKEKVSEFMKHIDVDMPVLLDEFQESAQSFGIGASGKDTKDIKLPRSFLIGSDMKIRAIYGKEGKDFVDAIIKDCR